MNTQKRAEGAYKETTDKDHIEKVPRGPLGPILRSPKQYEPPCRGGPLSFSYDSDGLNLNSDDNEKTKKEVY